MSAQSLVGETPTWDGSTYELISRERSYHDEAGRQNRSETLRENGTTPTYTETRSILLPGGHVWKSYPQTVGSGVRVLETSRDSLDRVTAQEEKIGTSPQTVSASVTTYSPTTGRVDKTTRIEWDEAESTTYDYETEYTYDARGRVTNTLDKGQPRSGGSSSLGRRVCSHLDQRLQRRLGELLGSSNPTMSWWIRVAAV